MKNSNFTQPCFIRMNNKELREKVENLGYINCANPKFDFQAFRMRNLEENTYLICNDGILNVIYKKDLDEVLPLYDNIIDCGTNEDIFLALAALRKDTDKNQWFICKDEYLSCHNLKPIKVGTWQLNIAYDKLTYSLKTHWRKAKTSEIIKYFNK